MTTRHIIYGHKSNRLNNYAITSADLATSLTKSVAALRTAGNSLEQVEALEVAGNAILQDADVVSNSLKVLSLRLRGTTGSALEEIGEDTEGLIEDFSKLNGKIQALTKTASNPEGVSIVDQQTKAYKSTYQILLEISKVWKDMGDMQKAELLEVVAGKTRASAAAGILSSPDILQQAYEDAMLNSTGAGQKALETAAESIEFKTNQIKDNFASIAREIFDAQGVKGVLDTVVDFSNELLKNTSGFQTLITAVETLLNLIIKVVANIPPEGIIGAIIGIKNLKGSWGNNIATNLFNKINTGIFTVPITSEDVSLLKNWFTLTEQGTSYQEAWNLTLQNTSKHAQDVAKNLILQGKSMDEATVAMSNHIKTSKALTIATGALNAALSIGVTLIVTWALSAFSKMTQAEENFAKAAEETAESFNRSEKDIDSYKQKINDLNDVINNENSSVEDVVGAKQDLFDIQKQLIEQFGNVAGGIDLITEAINGEISSLDKLKDTIWEEELAKFNLDNQGLQNPVDKTFMSGLEWIISLVSDYDTAKKILSEYVDSDYYNPAKVATTKWLNGDNTYATFAKRYFENEILKKNYSETYSGLQTLNSEYQQAITSVEGITAQQMEEFANRYTNLISGFSDIGQEKVNEIFYNLSANRNQYIKNKTLQDEIENEITTNLTDLISQVVPNTFRFFNAEPYTNVITDEMVGDWNNWVKQVLIDPLNIDSKEKMTVFKNALSAIEKEGNYTIEALKNKYNDYWNGWLKKLNPSKPEILSRYNEWLGENSTLSGSKEDEKVSNNEALATYKSSLAKLKDFIVNDREGHIEIHLSDIIQTVKDDELFQKLGLDFQSFAEQNVTEINKQLAELEKGGNVNLLLRPEIDAEELNKAGYDAGEGIATVFTHTFSNKTEDIAINFTPIIVDPNTGEYLGVMEPDAFTQYCEEIIAGVREDDLNLQIGAEFKGDDAIEQAEDAAVKIHDLHEKLSASNDNTKIFISFIETAEEKLKDTLSGTLKDSYLLEEQLRLIKEEALGWYSAESVYKIEQSYNELLGELEKVQNGYEYTEKEMDALTQKYPELLTAFKDAENGMYALHESSIKNLINSYAQMSNEAITAYNAIGQTAGRVFAEINKGAIKVALNSINAIMDVDRVLELYYSQYNQDYRGSNYDHGFFGGDTSGKNIDKQIADIIRKYEQPFDYDYKPTDETNSGSGGGSGDKDNKSRYDWLDSYLEKRNRNLQKEQTAYENLGKQIVKTGDIETQYTENQNKSLEEQNRLLDEQIAAYQKAEVEYGERMEEGLLYDDLMSAFKKDGGQTKVDEIIQKIINREDINLAEYTSEQQSAITAMMDNYNKKLDAADKQLEAQNQKRENSLQMFTNNIELITKKFDHVLNEFANRQEQLEHYQTMRTNAGFMENQKYYIALLDNESRELNANIEKRQTLIDTLKELKVETADDLAKWWETKDAIDATTKAIYENEEAIESYKMSMKQLSWDLNDRIRDITGNLRNETEFLMDTLSTFDADMYDYSREYLGNDAEKTKIYSGKMSDAGLSTMAMRRVRMESFMEDIQALNDEIDQVEQEYFEDTANTTILDRLTTLRDAQQDLIKSYNQEREAIVSLVQDGYDKQLQSLDAISNKYLEAAEQAKALYDRQRDLKKQTKTLSDLRKQLQAYSTDSSEEARAKTQSLTVQLQEAEENLADTQYQHQLDDQRQILDWLYQSLEDYFNDKLEDQIQIIDDTKQLVNDNMLKIKDTLSKSLDIYQTDISQSLKNILSDEGIGAVNSNIAAVDGDIRGITASVSQQTAELERYLAENEIGLPTEEVLQKRINTLFGEEGATGSFATYFKTFNDKLTEINNSINKIDKQSALELAKEEARIESYMPTAYTLNSNQTASQKGKDIYNTAKGIAQGVSEGLSVGNMTSISSAGSIASEALKKLKKYSSGKRLSSGELAWTQEDGLEAILRPTDNAILTPLKAGDSVLTAEATQNLWNFANNPLAFMKSTVGVPNSVSKNNGVTFNNAMSPTIVVNGVSNANEFIRELQKNKQFESMMQDMTVNLMNGGASLSKLKYKF